MVTERQDTSLSHQCVWIVLNSRWQMAEYVSQSHTRELDKYGSNSTQGDNWQGTNLSYQQFKIRAQLKAAEDRVQVSFIRDV